jgi:hypothetical protein
MANPSASAFSANSKPIARIGLFPNAERVAASLSRAKYVEKLAALLLARK